MSQLTSKQIRKAPKYGNLLFCPNTKELIINPLEGLTLEEYQWNQDWEAIKEAAKKGVSYFLDEVKRRGHVSKSIGELSFVYQTHHCNGWNFKFELRKFVEMW